VGELFSLGSITRDMLSTLIRIFFGVDMALGFFNYAAWSWIVGNKFSIWFLLLSIFSTHLPDTDMIPYLLFRRRYRLISHWVLGHHPLLVLPLVATVSFGAAKVWIPDGLGYTVAIVTTGVFLHFVHDGMDSLGFPWLSPFSMIQFRFQSGKFSVVPQKEIDEWRERATLWMQRGSSAADEISGRTPPMTLAQLLFWGVGIMALVIFIMESSYRNHAA
jgi:hypothetical protein